jgi:histone H3/H4
MAKLAKAPLREMLKEKGASRVSDEGLEEYRKKVEQYAYALAEITILCAEHGNRQTIMARDVRLATK